MKRFLFIAAALTMLTVADVSYQEPDEANKPTTEVAEFQTIQPVIELNLNTVFMAVEIETLPTLLQEGTDAIGVSMDIGLPDIALVDNALPDRTRQAATLERMRNSKPGPFALTAYWQKDVIPPDYTLKS